jgi:sugar phosphate isomerase/epimerase
MWLQNRYSRLVDFFAAGQAMGFTRFELSHILSVEMFDGFQPGDWQIVAVHDPCPRPADSHSLNLASLDEQVRARSVQVTRQTIDTAARYGAQLVCIHAGHVEMSRSYEIEHRPGTGLRNRALAGLKDTPEYAAALGRLIEARAQTQERHLEALIRSLEELLPYAHQQGATLACEVRYHAHEMPNFQEMGIILRLFDDSDLGFWFDTGHAQALAYLGLEPLDAWLEAYGEHIVGVHFHDIVGSRDHLVAGVGELDFAAIAPRIPESTVRTCEFDWYFTPQEVQAGVRHLQEAGCLPEG